MLIHDSSEDKKLFVKIDEFQGRRTTGQNFQSDTYLDSFLTEKFYKKKKEGKKLKLEMEFTTLVISDEPQKIGFKFENNKGFKKLGYHRFMVIMLRAKLLNKDG